MGYLLGLLLAGQEAEAVEHFERKIRPLLHAQCRPCHGPDKQKAGLRVDARAALLRGGDSGPALVPGKPEQSLLLKALRHIDPEVRMPPPKSGKTLPAGAAEDVEAWIRAGAPYPGGVETNTAPHWAFQPLRDPGGSVDGYLPSTSPLADPRTLIRRATYDLTGLPPRPEEVDAFLADAAPDAWPRLIDRLLASPAYGEKWGRKWLDLVRYADTAGENSDFPVPQAWRYRNYVIEAYNRDVPYDRFVREQVAGDLLAAGEAPERYAELVTATGFLAVARRFGHDTDKDMHLTHEDVIDTLGKSILGLTIACARCHNHKYDPVTARDYYALYGIFASTRFPFPGCEAKQAPRDLVPLVPAAELEARLKPWRDESAKLDVELKRRETEFAAARKGLAAEGVALASGELGPSGEQSFDVERVEVKPGDLIAFTLLPRANHGADSTLLELEIEGEGKVWNLTRDVLPEFAEGRCANPGAWLFYDPAPGPTLFSVFVKDGEKTPGLQVWRGPAALPSAFVNVRETPLRFATVTLPPRSLALHPGPGGPAAVAWESPIDGPVRVKGRVLKADPGGDGVAWKLERRPRAGPGLRSQKDALAALAALRKEIDVLKARKPKVDLAYAVVDGKPADAPFQQRGEPEQPGDPVPRRNLELFGGQGLEQPGQSGRLELARWLTDPKHPLTARVMANRIWQGHFGRGLVSTPSDFGTRGAPPAHPALLDHLASAFIAGGWSQKALHRKIMTSAAYRRADFPRRRLEAEELRDSLLAASGELDLAPGAGHAFPPEEQWKFTQHAPFKAVYASNKRSVYLMTQRIQRHPFLALFDGPDTNASTARREVSTVPTQALYFLNDPFFHARAEALARRLLALPEVERIAAAHRICFQRPSTEAEDVEARRFLKSYPAPEASAWSAYARTLLGSNEFLYLD